MSIEDGSTCTDCGTAPRWRHAWGQYCRYCATKGGQPSFVELDLDKLDKLLGAARVDEVLEKCARGGAIDG